MSDSKTIAASIFNTYAPTMQEALKAQGFTVTDDSTTETTAPTNPQTPLDLVIDENDDDESGLFINVYIVKNDQRYRLTFSSLDSDFLRYTDKDKSAENHVRNAVVSAVSTHGIEKAKEAIEFEVVLTQKGHSQELNLMD